MSLIIILPIHNRKNITVNFINNLRKQSFQKFKLVVVDDGSSDGSSDAIANTLPDMVILKGDGNLWWAGSVQLALNYIKRLNLRNETGILIINDDTNLPNDFLEVGLKLIQKEPKTMFCAQAYSFDGRDLLDQGVRIEWNKFEIRGAANSQEINSLSTRGLFFRFDALKQVGEFRPWLLPHYFSDYEFTVRAMNNGFALKCPPELKLRMFEAETGIRNFDDMPLLDYLKKVFSRRSTGNPVTAIIFILLAAPSGVRLSSIRMVLKSFRWEIRQKISLKLKKMRVN